MTLFWLLAALALSGLGGWMSRRWRVLGQAMMGLGGVALIGLIVWQVRQNVFQPEPRPPSRYQMAVSYQLANCLLRDMASQGGKVLLLFPQQRVMDAATEGSYEDGFVTSLRHSRVRPELKAVHLEGANGDLSAFKQALAQAPEAVAVVSYAGVPAGFDSLFSTGPADGPLFYVFDGDGTTHWLAPLKSGRIKAVVVPRPGVNARDGEGIAGMPQTIFDRFYFLATQANADEVAASQPGQKAKE